MQKLENIIIMGVLIPIVILIIVFTIAVGIYDFGQVRVNNQIFTKTCYEAGGTIYRTKSQAVCLRDDGTMVVTGNMIKEERL